MSILLGRNRTLLFRKRFRGLYGARINRRSNQTATTATWTAVQFTDEHWDDIGFHDKSTNNTRITIPAGFGGRYLIGGHLAWEINATGIRAMRLYKNGTTVDGLRAQFAAIGTTRDQLNATTIVNLSATDYLELFGQQTSGGNLDIEYLYDDSQNWGYSSPEYWLQKIDISDSASGARIYHDANQTLAHDTWTDLAFNQERWDDTSYHDTVTNNERLTIPANGRYIIGANILFSGDSTGWRGLRFLINGTTFDGAGKLIDSDSGGNTLALNANMVTELSAGDYVTLSAKQTSGGNLNVLSAGDQSPEFWIERVDVLPNSEGARIYHNANQTISTGSWTSLSFNQERWDDIGFHDTVINNDRITIPSGYAGRYLIGATIFYDANATGYRSLRIRKNGRSIDGAKESVLASTAASTPTRINASAIVNLKDGDFLTIDANHNSGGNLDVVVTGNASPEFWIQRLE